MYLLPATAQVKPTIAVLGDSYSTFEGFIPQGNAVWYHGPADFCKKYEELCSTGTEG